MLSASHRRTQRRIHRIISVLGCIFVSHLLGAGGTAAAQEQPATGRAASIATVGAGDSLEPQMVAPTFPTTAKTRRELAPDGASYRRRSLTALAADASAVEAIPPVLTTRPRARTIWASGALGKARLRGDHEDNNLLLLVWQPEWEDAVKHVAASAARDVEVQILVPRGAWAASRPLRRWAERNCVGVSFQRYDTAWIRDYGPLQFDQGGKVTWRDFGYDQERPEDDALPVQLAADFGVPLEMSKERLDGGGLVNNGNGLCVMTDRSLDEFMTESGHRRANRFAAALGCEALTVVSALPEEQTGHADVSVQFLARDLVAVASMDHTNYPLHARLLDRAADAIVRAADRMHQPMRVLRVPMTHDGEVFYSYVNAVRGGSNLFVPSYRQVPLEIETAAHTALALGVPHLKVVAVPSDEIAEYGGALHCITLGLNVPAKFRQTAMCRRTKLHRRRHRRPPSPGVTPVTPTRRGRTALRAG